MASPVELLVLGAAQDGGLPHLGCTGPCCNDARGSGRVETPACVALRNLDSGGLLLLEATPAITAQVALLHELLGAALCGTSIVDAIAITHAHIGHYTGLMYLGRECAATSALPVHVSQAVADLLRSNAPWSNVIADGHVVLRPFSPGVPFEPMPGLCIEPVLVPHRDELSETVAFKVHGPNCSAMFCPDIDRWDGMLEPLLGDVDVALLDGTFFDDSELPSRDRASIPHPTMVDTMRRIEGMGDARPTDVRFIHLNHSNAAFHGGAAAAEVTARGFRIARAGDRIQL